MDTCKQCSDKGHVVSLERGERVLCDDCTVACPDCDGRGWTYFDEEREACDLCAARGWLRHKWVAKHEKGLGSFRFLRDIEWGPTKKRMNRHLSRMEGEGR